MRMFWKQKVNITTIAGHITDALYKCKIGIRLVQFSKEDPNLAPKWIR